MRGQEWVTLDRVIKGRDYYRVTDLDKGTSTFLGTASIISENPLKVKFESGDVTKPPTTLTQESKYRNGQPVMFYTHQTHGGKRTRGSKQSRKALHKMKLRHTFRK